MKKYCLRVFSIICLLVFFSFLFNCGGDKVEAGSPEEVLLRVKEKGNSDSVLKFYTDDTVSLLKKYMKLTGMKNETAVDILSFIPETAEYKISREKIEKNFCDLEIVFIKHPSENAVGQTLSIKMVRENKNWKIDKKNDFSKLVESYEKKGVEGYLKRIR